MKGATPKENQLEKPKNDPDKPKEQSSNASRENMHQTKMSWKIARMISADSESRSDKLTR